MGTKKDKSVPGQEHPRTRIHVSRRQFAKRLTGAWASAIAMSSAAGVLLRPRKVRAQPQPGAVSHDYEAVIVGSGFGGAVSAARLSRAWPGRVLLLERGRRYERGSFPRDRDSLLAALRRDASDKTPRPLPLPGKSNGLLDLRSYRGIDILVANGYGGGSLLYGAALIEPSDPSVDRDWPSTIKLAKLRPYYEVFKKVLGAAKVPLTDEPERQLPRLDYYERVAEATGGTSKCVPIGVFFGNDPDRPTPMGQREINRHGVEQTSCTYCAECVLGCNYHAKSSVDLNYLHVAEHRYGMEVRTETAVDRIAALDADGNESANEDGTYGYRITMRAPGDGSETHVTAKRVVLAAGTLGTTEILLRNKNVHRTLPYVSRRLGRRFSANGDFLGLVPGGRSPDGNAYGPTVVQTITYNDARRPERSHVLEDMSLPPLGEILDWLLEICDGSGPMHGFWRRIKDLLEGDGSGKNAGFATQVFVGLDASDGEMSLGRHGELRLNWSFLASRHLYHAIIGRIGDVRRAVGGWAAFYLPTYLLPLRRNMTVHPLGGCALAFDRSQGVTSAQRDNFGEVFGYSNLYVADGSLVPSSLGANPALTIAAFAEMVAEGITGQPATAQL